jgi:glycosyltransferase family protein
MIQNTTLRYGKSFHLLRQFVKHTLSASYPLFTKIYKMPTVLSVEDTLVAIEKNKKACVVRFGDGEILYMTDKLNLPFQKYEERLSKSFQEILKNNHPNLFVGLPEGYHSLKNMSAAGHTFWQSQIVWNYPRFKKYLNLQSTYFNASITRLYYGFERSYTEANFNRWKQILKADSVLLIEGEKTRFGIGNDLLDGVKQVNRILGPKHHAFDRADEIIAYVEQFDKSFDLILIALGPAAKYITLQLFLKGYRVLDVGNLDIEYEWYLRGVTERIAIPGKYTSEVKGGREVVDLEDDTLYKSQIVANFI